MPFFSPRNCKVVAEAKGFATKVWPAVSERVSGFKNRRFQNDMVEEELKNDGASAFGVGYHMGTKEPAYSITTGNRYVRT